MADQRLNRAGERGDAARLLLAAARERFSVAAIDLVLPEQTRLSEWQRLTASTLLGQLVRSIEDVLRAALAERFADNDALCAALSSAHVAIAQPMLERSGALRDADLGTILVRRVEEHRFYRAHGLGGAPDLILDLIRDADGAIAAQAMALLIARSRRFDRFQEPVMAETELPAEIQHRLIWLIAAALRQYIISQHGLAPGIVDAALSSAGAAMTSTYDESVGLEAQAMRLAALLDRTGRLDEALLLRALEEGGLSLFIAGISIRSGLDYHAGWEILSDPHGRGPALLLRAASVGRNIAAAILLILNTRGRLFSGAEGDATEVQLDLYDRTERNDARAVMQLWQVDPGYRAAIARLSTRGRGTAEAA
jgi:uncharacterized protein (DUF2336 family)